MKIDIFENVSVKRRVSSFGSNQYTPIFVSISVNLEGIKGLIAVDLSPL